MAREFPATGVLAASVAGRMVSYVLFIVHDDTLYLKMFGRDYDLDAYGTHFLVACHEPIKLGFEAGLRFVEYGPGTEDTRLRRNIEMVPGFNYVLDLLRSG